MAGWQVASKGSLLIPSCFFLFASSFRGQGRTNFIQNFLNKKEWLIV
jgi:hypothetical protein